MACEVTVKDIRNRIRNVVADKFESTRFTSYSDRLVGFIPYDALNPSKNVLYGKVKNLESQLNREYGSSIYGSVASFNQMRDGIEFNIHPTRKLADAMTQQNYQDEGAVISRTSYSRREAQSETPPVAPITDNYGEFVRYKQDQIEFIDSQIKKFRTELNSTNINSKVNSSDLNSKIRKLNIQKQKVSTQLEQLAKQEVDVMFHAIKEDLQDIKDSFKDISVTDTVELGRKIDFYDEFISGNNKEYKGQPLSNYDNDNFGEISGAVRELQDLYKSKILTAVRETIEEDSFIKDLMNSNEDLKLDTLLQAQKDINWLEKMFIGITADRTNNTVIPQVMMSTFKQSYARNFTTYIDFSKRFKKVLEDTGLTDFDFIFERDSLGNRTGFITDVFSPKWYKELRKYETKVSEYFKEPNEANYREAVEQLLQNSEVIDFTRLSAVKEIYGELYPEYFTYTDEQIEAYEDNVRNQLGPRYQDVVDQALDRLSRFEEFKVDAYDTEDNTYSERNIAANNLWEFNKLVRTGRALERIPYNHEGNTYGVYFRAFRDLAILPKSYTKETKVTDEGIKVTTKDTGFYSSEFQELMYDTKKLAYWEIVKEMSEYINSTYNLRNHGRLSYPKIQEEYAERFFDSLGDIKKGKLGKGFGNIFSAAMHGWKGFFYEEGSYKSPDTDVIANYFDVTDSETHKLAQTYMIQGLGRDEAYSIAKENILRRYSSDFNRDILGVVMEATLHNTRLEVAPISEAFIHQFKDIGPERKNAIEKLEFFHDKVILNRGENYRGSGRSEGRNLSTWFERSINILSSVPFVKKYVNEKSAYLLSDSEKEIFKGLQQARAQGHPKNDFKFSFNEVQYIKKDGEFYQRLGEDVSPMTEQEYNDIFNQYIEDQISKLGLDFNLAGFIQGVLKTVIYKGLGFNPVSGIFNRIEGKHSAMIMDMTGEYWAPGNIDAANNFLAFANIIRLSPEKLPTSQLAKRAEIEKFEAFLRMMNTVQDRKNELQKNSEESRFDRGKWNLFAFAVDNPEFKNQGGIILAMLMDKKIVDINGVEHSLFDGEKLVPYNLVDGALQLKPEFDTEQNRAEFQDFSSEEIFKLKIRMEDTISRSQGNYDVHDIMLAKKSIWGKAATMFMTWFPEHVNQRFGSSAEGNVNIFTGKKRQDGRFVAGFRANKLNFAGYAFGALGVSYGLLGGVGLMATGALGAIVYQKFLKKLAGPQAIKRDINYAMEFVEFLKSTLIETLNYPGRMLNVNPRYQVKNNSFKKTSMTEEEINSMRAMTRELSIMLTVLLIKLMLGAAMFDEDDDKESPERMRYNFMQNQLSRAISSLAIYTNPQELVSDNSRIAALETVSSVGKILMSIWSEKQREDLGKNVGNLTPIPRILTKGELPWENKKNFDELSNLTGLPTPLKWTDDYIKDVASGGETSAKREYTKLRKEAKERLVDELSSQYEGKELQEAVRKAMELEFPKKEPGESNLSIMNRIESGEKGKPSKDKKTNKKATRKQRETFKNNLKAKGLSNEEIALQMREEFRGR